MDNNVEADAERTLSAREQILRDAERVIAERELALRARESKVSEIEQILTEREGIAGLQEAAARARTETEHAKMDRERLMGQLCSANEHLLLSTLRADELTEESEASRTIATEGRLRAEALIAQVQLAEAKAIAAGRAKDEFLAMLGHELRNPLAPIQTALDLMTMRDPRQFQRERTIIERQVHYLVRLVDDLLDVSRIAGGKVELHRVVVDLVDVVALAIEIAAPLLEAKAHHLTVSVKPGLVIDGDVTRLAQVISNLVTNAAKYTKAQGTIEILGERRGSSVWLVVRDNGIGISAEMLPHVFELFAQEAQAIDRPAGGLGLGLAIVHSLVALHGGTVTAHSEGLGHGSEFALQLPTSTGTLGQTPLHPITTSGPILVSRKVLVVDDNPDAAELISLALGRHGHDTRVAIDAPSALEQLKNFVPDVVLLDISLPVIDGYELAQMIREAVAPHRIQFIAITGYGQPADLERSKTAGFALHLVKPVSTAMLEHGIHVATRATSEPGC